MDEFDIDESPLPRASWQPEDWNRIAILAIYPTGTMDYTYRRPSIGGACGGREWPDPVALEGATIIDLRDVRPEVIIPGGLAHAGLLIHKGQPEKFEASARKVGARVGQYSGGRVAWEVSVQQAEFDW